LHPAALAFQEREDEIEADSSSIGESSIPE